MASFSASSSSFKVCILGNEETGKSTMIACLEQKGNEVPLNKLPQTSIRYDIYSYKVKTQGKNITLKIWDTAGQEKFLANTRQAMRDARVVLLVYDITSNSSFQSITDWFLEAKECVVRSNPIYILVGNKMDLHEHRQVKQSIAHDFARSHYWDYFETSALLGGNILYLFDQIAKDLSRMNLNDEIHINDVNDESDTITLLVNSSSEKVRKSKCGCQKRNMMKIDDYPLN